MRQLAQNSPDKLVDLLSERLSFEQSGVKLYDAVIGKMRASGDPFMASLLGEMEAHRRQEQEHAVWLEQQIVSLGGDAENKSDSARVAETETQGIEQVIIGGRDGEFAHMFHALLTAELVDNAGWELLLELADEANDVEARAEFKKRLFEEEDHLMLVRRAVEALAASAVLGIQTPAGTAH